MKNKPTKIQQEVIDFRGKNLLVSASAGTGKTATMIERIATLIEEGVDVSNLVVVTFTTLAAAEMRNRLSARLAEKRNNPQVIAQLEQLDRARICTIDSFCNDLLRNYFYVVDIDPSFSILDSGTLATLKNNVLDGIFKQYFASDDKIFKQVYKIFSTNRREENFKEMLLTLYNYGRCLEDFEQWYACTRENFANCTEDGVLAQVLLGDIRQHFDHYKASMKQLHEKSLECGLVTFAEGFLLALRDLEKADLSTLQQAVNAYATINWRNTIPDRSRKKDFLFDGVDKQTEESVRADFDSLKGDLTKNREQYTALFGNKTVSQLLRETQQAVVYTDKIVEILQKFDQEFFAAKKQRGGLDFADLEHLTLKLLQDEEASKEICQRCQLVFVDEYQDTNPLQEALISRLSQQSSLFMVGDIKQSIYGFRGCDSSIFLEKYRTLKQQDAHQVKELNDNFRTNNEILQYVNSVFNQIMTADFGSVDYARDAQLVSTLPAVVKTDSVQIDLIEKQAAEKETVSGLYDITAPSVNEDSVTQGQVIAERILNYVGKAYKDGRGVSRKIDFDDIVILMRSVNCEKGIAIYNSLVEHNIPVAANFKTEGYANKEVRELINLLRAVDNPYNDVYLVGTCLAPFGNFTEDQLAEIKVETSDRVVPFYTRMQIYAESAKNAEISAKIDSLIAFLNNLRFYSHSATVDETILRVLKETNYHLYVQGLPNGALRLRKLYTFIDGLKGASYAQSIDKFLMYLDDLTGGVEESVPASNAVRIMTMHASKGLEFPIVIIAAAETDFSNETFALPRNTKLGLAMKHYDFSDMRVYDSLGARACEKINRLQQKEEEMRLLYVAMTRAKYVLHVVGTATEKEIYGIAKDKRFAQSHLDWILTAHKHNYGSMLAPSPVKINVITTRPDVSQRTRTDLLCKQETDKAAVLERINYKYPYADQMDMPSKIVSSALDRAYLDIDSTRAETVLEENDDRNFIGTAYHKLYQFVDYTADKQQIAATVDALVASCQIESRYGEILKQDVDGIYATLNNPELKKILSQGEVRHEVPFMLNVPYDQVALDKRFSDEVMLQGVIDLLVLDAENNCATVVDFKYTSRSERSVKASYKAQLNSYRLAVQNICHIQKVDCYILSICDNKLIKM